MNKKIYKIAVAGKEKSITELKQTFPSNVLLSRVNETISADVLNDYDALFILDRNYGIISEAITIPVFINEITQTISELSLNAIRVNLWPGFAGNDVWEICGELTAKHEFIIKEMGKNFLRLPDEPGLISARVIAMIINEAYFTIEEGVSSEKEIDTAMKLGTNYPYGPIEWGKKIGLNRVFELLTVLSKTNNKYKPAPLLEQNSF